MKDENASWIDTLKWDAGGLIPAIAQDEASGRVLMLAWMNRDSLEESMKTGNAVYWSRSRRRLWRKGEESGHIQTLKSIRVDCDGDALLLTVVQAGGIACHTGRKSCFFREFREGRWISVDPVLKEPREIYSK
ncbi:MAG: phosphoribosyl-AMP cyclohydrolase [Candidatus Accumulibacter sp.]|jgi:phosphoribosyl-AMP cyclohydrolase|nr:phosphoribosyl-AMP cyclohydrolase [Accumulibacter sp.]